VAEVEKLEEENNRLRNEQLRSGCERSHTGE
jgi:hypothetical protein